uniref:Nitrilase and fragile histidine triad fusion protein NitFhit n=1 Tax=Trichuris muris TaxID=70415 RepID=A0A5S6R2W2_TRIMR
MSEALIAVCQMRSESDKEMNWKTCEYLMRRARDGAARMVFFPECFDYMETSRRDSIENASAEDDEFIGRFRSLAKELDLWVSLGGFHEKCVHDSQRVYNAHIIIDSSGNTVLKYRKLHLFDIDIPNEVSMRESDQTLAGECIPFPVRTPVGVLSAGTCYDLRFPELCRIARQNGAEILSFPSAFTMNTGMAHWEVLLRSRAIDYQCYVVAAAQFGRHNERRSSYGHAMVVDPWGTIVAQCSNTEPSLCFANVDLPFLEMIRKRLPVTNHLRHDLYRTSFVGCQRLDPNLGSESYAFADKVIPKSCVFYLTSRTYGFVNRKPVVEGHVLVAPLRPVQKLSMLDAEEVADLFMCVQDIERTLEVYYKVSSSTVCIQDGPEAGQTVQHVHVHILPRRRNDFPENDDVYVALEKHDKEDSEKSWRSLEEMSKEAAVFRSLFSMRQ